MGIQEWLCAKLDGKKTILGVVGYGLLASLQLYWPDLLPYEQLNVFAITLAGIGGAHKLDKLKKK